MLEILEPYENLVSDGYLNKQEKGSLVLYNYTDSCTFERYWNEYTKSARGIIFNKETGECVARPFPKFHNLGETEETQLHNLPDEPYDVFEKMDGSLGILYPDGGKYYIATRGSFASVQALTATQILKDKYPDIHAPTDTFESGPPIHKLYTLLFEIIYPENRLCAGGRLVCDYGDMRDLVLLGAINRADGHEMLRDDLVGLAEHYGLPIAQKHHHTIEEMVGMQKTLPVEKEGFVVHFLKSNLRVKVKGDEYCKRQKILNGMTPLNMWAVFEKGAIPDTYKVELPEEILPEALVIEADLAQKYHAVKQEVEEDAKKIPYTLDGSKDARKNIGLWLQANKKLKHHGIMFSYILNKEREVEEWIKEAIRPHNNVL